MSFSDSLSAALVVDALLVMGDVLYIHTVWVGIGSGLCCGCGWVLCSWLVAWVVGVGEMLCCHCIVLVAVAVEGVGVGSVYLGLGIAMPNLHIFTLIYYLEIRMLCAFHRRVIQNVRPLLRCYVSLVLRSKAVLKKGKQGKRPHQPHQ